MNLTDVPLFNAITQKMSWLNSRLKVLAENIENADTPNYEASDLKPLDFSGELSNVQKKLMPAVTNAGHMTLVSATGGGLPTERMPSPEERSINGNTVSSEDEMIKLSQSSADYQLMTNLYKKQLSMLKMAIGQSGSSGS